MLRANNLMLNMQEHMLPAEYVAVMKKSMLSACPVSSYSQVLQGLYPCLMEFSLCKHMAQLLQSRQDSGDIHRRLCWKRA